MHRIYSLVRDGSLAILAPGCFVAADWADSRDAWGRFALQSGALALGHPEAHLTGWAATVVRGYPTLGRPPHLPTALRPAAPGRGSRTLKHGRLLVANVPDEHLYLKGPLGVMSPAWSVADIARCTRLPDALVVAEEAVRRGVDLKTPLAPMSGWRGVSRARWVATVADPCVETSLETLGRFAFFEFRFPLPVANAWIGRDGPERRVDGLLPWHWWAYEGDGAGKYDDRPESQVVRDQNEREFMLRRLGLDFARFQWEDVYPRRDPFVAKVRAMFRDYPVRDRPVRYWKHVPGRGAVLATEKDWPSPYPAPLILPAGWQIDARDGDGRSNA